MIWRASFFQRVALIVLFLPGTVAASETSTIFPTVTPIEEGLVGIQAALPLGFLLSDPWTATFGNLDAASYRVEGAWVVLACEVASDVSPASLAVGSLSVSWDGSASLPPVSASVETPLDAGCDAVDRAAGETWSMSADFTEVAKAWLDGTVAPEGLVVYGASPVDTDWSASVDLDGHYDHAPYVVIEISSCTDADLDAAYAWDDCDDGDPARYPGAEEACNGEDDDCDGEVDEGFDADGDGWLPCGPDGTEMDCDDGDASRNPGTYEACDGDDDDCDGLRDEDCPYDGADNDLDGFREIDGDEDDADPSIYPGSPESQAQPPEDDGSCGRTEVTTVAAAGCNSTGQRRGPQGAVVLIMIGFAGLRPRRGGTV